MTDSSRPLHRPRLPSGPRRLVARAPILLFRAGLGWVFGKRLLLLHHTGRVSGLDRRVVLEVVQYDASGWTVASGFGPRAAWYRNLRAQPKTVVQVGNRHHAVTAHFLTPDEGAAVMSRYAARTPRLARRLCAFMGFHAADDATLFREAGRSIPFVRLSTGISSSQEPEDH
ncbi:nitroreductase family deazaflavin-dependent oxidoreductase [Streptomyces sp. NPDC004042]|uniref:nitroreductase family deazaflavin-dependent oxidoreductase n=1 Tax=Streptomyces sp. NPDC004042 TaxID=3154451 RepID=UPI0033A323A5